jgi:hypothetical protein
MTLQQQYSLLRIVSSTFDIPAFSIGASAA